MSGLVLLLILGSVYRLSMLVTDDEITAPARDAALRWMNRPRHSPVEEIKSRDGVWLSMTCRCGHRVYRQDDQIVEWVAGRGTVLLATNMEPMAVLSHFNVHRNAHSGEPRFDRFPILITCPWCCSAHIAPIVVASGITYGTHGWWLLAAGTLTASAVTGIIATFAKP